MIDIGDLVTVIDPMRSRTYASPRYQQLGIILNLDYDEFENIEGIEVLLNNQEVLYCFPEEISVCSCLS